MLVVAFSIDAIQSVLVIDRYDVEFGTRLWVSFAGVFLVFAVSAVSALLLFRNWSWAVWVWAILVAVITLVGLALGLNRSFVLRWEVALPWILLAACAVMGLKQARPWQDAA